MSPGGRLCIHIDRAVCKAMPVMCVNSLSQVTPSLLPAQMRKMKGREGHSSPQVLTLGLGPQDSLGAGRWGSGDLGDLPRGPLKAADTGAWAAEPGAGGFCEVGGRRPFPGHLVTAATSGCRGSLPFLSPGPALLWLAGLLLGCTLAACLSVSLSVWCLAFQSRWGAFLQASSLLRSLVFRKKAQCECKPSEELMDED